MQKHPFDLLMELDAADIRLDCAALHLARDAHPDLDLFPWLRLLDEMADEVAAQRPGLTAPQRYEAIRRVLVEGFELRGNADDYYDPANSYLNRVLEARLGIPISLSVVWVEVGRRLKWPIAGVGFPGHFLVRIDDAERCVLIDPFREGAALSVEDCKTLLAEHYSRQVEFSPKLIEPVGTRDILVRMLANLRAIYRAREQWTQLELVLRRLLAIEPGNAQHIQDLAAVRSRQGDLRAAHAYLAAFLGRRAATQDHQALTRHLRELEAQIASLN